MVIECNLGAYKEEHIISKVEYFYQCGIFTENNAAAHKKNLHELRHKKPLLLCDQYETEARCDSSVMEPTASSKQNVVGRGNPHSSQASFALFVVSAM